MMDKETFSPELDDNKLKECYKNIIFQKYGVLNFADYAGFTSKRENLRLDIPLAELFLPFDFSQFGHKDKPIMDSTTLLEDTHNKIILGGPGCGKTTFLRFALLHAFKRNLIPVYWEWKKLYNHFKEKKELQTILVNHLKELLTDTFELLTIESFIAHYHFVFLIDGFDEVDHQAILPMIKTTIEKYITKNPWNYFMITSRTANYPQAYHDYFSALKFQHYQINPLPEHLIFQYINKFITLQLEGEPLRSAEKIKYLSKYIERQPGIKTLASHPLLLSLIVLIYTFEGSLPDTKVNLYERCIELLIAVWKKSDKDVQLFNELLLDTTTLNALLSEIAYAYLDKYIKGQVSEFGLLPGKELKEILKSTYKHLVRGRKRDQEILSIVEKLFSYFKNNTGVIVETSPDIFGFSHLSLLEYLSAHRIVTEKSDFTSNLDFIVELIQQVDDQKFRAIEEVIIFQVELLAKSTSKTRFIDLLTRQIIAIFKQKKNLNLLILLAKLLRDNQDFSIHDTTEILKLITIAVARNPENLELYNLLNEIFLLSSASRDHFVALMGKSVKEKEIWGNFSMRTGHRIGNKVFSIRSDLNIIEKEYKKLAKQCSSEKIELKLALIQEKIQSLNLILAEYRDFASEIDVEQKEYDVDKLLQDMVKKFQRVYPKIRIQYTSLETQCLVFTDKSRLEQIVEELIEDSKKHAHVESLEINLTLEHGHNRFVIHYRDNGQGVPDSLKTKIFEPFFSTDSKSTGIGLANIKKIIESLNGEITEIGIEHEGVHFLLTFIMSWRSHK